jgi:beta-fructofuranosidase
LLRHLAPFALAALLAAPVPARAAVMLPTDGTRPKDFAMVKKDGVYHLFYIRHNDLLPPWATEIDFGHATSTDLYRWTQLPPVLGVGPNDWDNLHVWAPSIVNWGGLWWMFYAGVTDDNGRQFRDTQRIGAAVSSDLMTWTRTPEVPVWSNAQAPWAWWSPLNGAMACRDPYVMPDPRQSGQWLMYYTSSPASDTTATLVAVASSTGDPGTWHDEKPLWITYKSYTGEALTESPHLFSHNGRWFMFITTNSGQPLSFYVSSDPLGDPPAWTYRGHLSTMLGYDTANWYASEEMRDGSNDLFAFVDGDRVEFHDIVWGSGDNFSLAEPAFFHMVSMGWTRPTVNENQYVGLSLKSANGFAPHSPLVAWVKDVNGNDMPAPIASLGIQPNPDLSADSTLVPWFTKRWPSTLPANQPMRVRVATADATASTDWLDVYSNAIGQPHASGPGGTMPVPPLPDPSQPVVSPNPPSPPDSLAHAISGPGPTPLRVILNSPLGGAPAVVLELAAPTSARVDVFDVQGRRLVTLADQSFSAGANVLPWDGRDAGGARVSRGLYFVRMSTPERVLTTRFFLDR